MFKWSGKGWFCGLVCMMALPFNVRADSVDDRFRQMQYDAVQQKKQQENAAVSVLLHPEHISDSHTLMSLLLQAVNQENAALTAQLLEQYLQLPDYEPDMVLFVRANQAVWRNDIKQAIALYQEIYRRNPEFLRGKLDLARLLFTDKQNREAQALFTDIRLPEKPVVQEKVDQYLQAIEQRGQWHGSIGLGWGRDSNINRGSGSTIWRRQRVCVDDSGLPLLDANGNLACQTISLPATAEAALDNSVWSYDAGVSRQYPIAGHHNAHIAAYAYGNIYPNRREYSEHNINIQPSYFFQNYQHQLNIGPVYQASVLDGHLFSSSAGAQIKYGYQFSPKSFASVQIEHKYDHYRDKALQHFNGAQNSVFTQWMYAFDSGWLMFGGYDFLRKSSREKVDSYRRHGFRLGVNKTFQAGLEITAQAAWRHTQYDGYNAWFDAMRKDKEISYLIDLGFNRLTRKNITPSLSFKHTRNHSNAWVNDYKRNEIGLKLRYSF